MTPVTATATIPSPPPLGRPAWRYILLATVFMVSVVYQLGLTQALIHGLRITVPYFALREASAKIDVASAAATAAGLKRGDVLLAVNGRPYQGVAVLAQEESKATPGKKLVLSVRNDSGEHRVELPVTESRAETGQNAVAVLLLIVTPWFCLLLGCWVVLVRPRDRLAWLLLGILLGFTQLFGAGRTIQALPVGLAETATVFHFGLVNSWPVFMFLFGYYFPEPFPPSNRIAVWSGILRWLIVIPIVLVASLDTIVRTIEVENYGAATKLFSGLSLFNVPAQILSYVAVGSFFAFIFSKSSAQSLLPPDARRRLRILYWGATIAMTPILLVSVGAALKHAAFELLPEWLTYPLLVLLLLFPLTLAYVIVVQRAMDVRVVVRQGLQYGLAKTGVRILQLLLILLMAYFAMRLITDRSASMLLKAAVLVTAVIGFRRITRRADTIRNWVDRRFFREAYNTDQVLGELSDHVRGMVETKSLIETVAARIAETLHITQVAVLLGGSGPYRPAYALGYNASPDVTFSPGAGAIKALQASREPARVYFDDPDSWLYRDPDVSDDDRQKLASLQAELLLPLSTRDHLLGFISLGHKRSEEPYSGTDLRLLKSVAAQTGLALENARLISAMAEEVAQRERLNREVEIAREVQERLFPQTLPTIQGVEYAGACRPALGVGGDYYDFLALPRGQLGIAIGDVSGKGIAAALMMASLQASLRGEATRAPENLAALVSNVNRLVYEASSANRYATFFYAQYNPNTRQLTYVNAGHNPPMLFHGTSGQWEITRLETGGTVVGLLESFPYQQATVTIEPNDLFVAFTDGISEAMNNSDEEWGEEHLMETIKACTSLTPSETITRVMQAADVFVAGAKQHDDMTLVVLRAQP
jgi:phosphoserine phosphatase RsbU/P